MASLRDIKKKLHAVGNIKKITQAMEMVAASRLRKAQDRAERSRPYSQKLQEIVNRLIAVVEDFSHPIINKREVKKTGFIVIAGDRGLCGGYNNTVLFALERRLKQYSPDKVELILIGRKAVEHFAGTKWKVLETVSEWGGTITYKQIEALTLKIIDNYLHFNLDEIWLVYSHYINLASRKVVIEKFLNLENPNVTADKTFQNYIFEPEAKEILTELLPRYYITKLKQALDEAYASELSARIFAMRSATKNADEMIDSLTLIRNKIRQAGITRELIEITAGAQTME